MITISANTFSEIGQQLSIFVQPTHSLTIKLYSTYDAPALFPAMSQQKADRLAGQTEFMIEPIENNPSFSDLQSFKLYCHFTLNNWKSFDKLVEILNNKNDDINIEFITSVEITEDSFIYRLKNCTGKVEQWS